MKAEYEFCMKASYQLLWEISEQGNKKEDSGKKKCFNVRAVISIVEISSDWLINYYMANQNFKFVYIVILWGLKTAYLNLSVYSSTCFSETFWEPVTTALSQSPSLSLSLFHCLPTPHIPSCVRLFWPSSRQLCKETNYLELCAFLRYATWQFWWQSLKRENCLQVFVLL